LGAHGDLSPKGEDKGRPCAKQKKRKGTAERISHSAGRVIGHQEESGDLRERNTIEINGSEGEGRRTER